MSSDTGKAPELNAITRRRFVHQAGGVLAAAGFAPHGGWLIGCGSESRRAPDWSALSDRLSGTLALPDSRLYERVSPPLNQRYASVHPQGVALCEDADDVRESIDWARESGVPIAVRSGGHNYAGYSIGPGLVVNVGRMQGVEVDDREGTVRAQPGARNTGVYAGLQPHGVAISAGRCPTVAIGGLVLGGGIGFSSRKIGLTCDHLIEAEVITAAGDHLSCSERENPDLFWALRGGGGGNFGICTSYTFKTVPVDDVAIYDIEWDWRDADAVFAAFQEVMASAPDELSARIGVGRAGGEEGGSEPVISALGQFFGSEDDLSDLLAPALRAGRVKRRLIEARTFWQAKNYFFATVPSEAYAVKSAYLDRPLDDDGVDVLLRAVERWPGSSNPDGAGAAMFASGGAINRVDADATAFVHRDQFALLATESTWTEGDPETVVERNVAWLDQLAEGLQPHLSGSAYQNFIDRSQPDWEDAYYGKNFARLSEVKGRYDPADLFSFEQSIPPA